MNTPHRRRRQQMRRQPAEAEIEFEQPQENNPPMANAPLHQEPRPSGEPTPEPPPRPAMHEDMRSEMRGETSREEAERLAREFLEKRGNMDSADFHDEFDIGRLGVVPPDGWEYQWKRRLSGGKEEPEYQAELEMHGWRAVPAKRHPELMPSKGIFELIERKGQILMECPKMLTDRQRHLEYRRAMERLETNRRRLGGAPEGHFQERIGDRVGSAPKLQQTYENLPPGAKPKTPLQVPGDE